MLPTLPNFALTGAEDYLKEHIIEDVRSETHNWRLLLSEEEISLINDFIASEINRRYLDEKNVVITCILKGAVYFLVDLTRRLKFPYSLYFIEASSYFDGQTQQEQITVSSKIVASKFNDKKVILIDELFDNGKTLENVKQKILSTENITISAKDIFTCCLFRKEKLVKFFLFLI